MPGMTDPMDALIDFRRAVREREIRLQPADFHPDVFVHVDQPADTPRYTYALAEGGEVTAVALFALTEPIEGVAAFQLGYAVMEPLRGCGRAPRIAMAALDEICRGLRRNGIMKLYFEAVVDPENLASLHIAEKVIGGPRTECLDHNSGVPVSAPHRFQSVEAEISKPMANDEFRVRSALVHTIKIRQSHTRPNSLGFSPRLCN